MSGRWEMRWTTEKEILFLVEKGFFGQKCLSVYQVIADSTMTDTAQQPPPPPPHQCRPGPCCFCCESSIRFDCGGGARTAAVPDLLSLRTIWFAPPPQDIDSAAGTLANALIFENDSYLKARPSPPHARARAHTHPQRAPNRSQPHRPTRSPTPVHRSPA
jgi:hypothetical protein